LNQNLTDPRDRLMAALSVVEHVTAALPVAPPTVNLHEVEGGYSIELLFRSDPTGVIAFADVFGVEVVERVTAGGGTYTDAHVTTRGHEVRAWWVGAAPELVALPAEWSAAGAA
jgi:hypothetical protein